MASVGHVPGVVYETGVGVRVSIRASVPASRPDALPHYEGRVRTPLRPASARGQDTSRTARWRAVPETRRDRDEKSAFGSRDGAGGCGTPGSLFPGLTTTPGSAASRVPVASRPCLRRRFGARGPSGCPRHRAAAGAGEPDLDLSPEHRHAAILEL